MEPGSRFLLLTSHLGNPARKPLTIAQMRTLADRVQQASPQSGEEELTEKHLLELGYDGDFTNRILNLLDDEALLERYLSRARNCSCNPITRQDSEYPLIVRRRLGLDSPGCLWTKGDMSLLGKPAVAVVGSRVLRPKNFSFAQEAGRQIAKQGFVLVSGNASGADTVAQEACLDAGGSVISIVADELFQHEDRPNILYLSEEEFDEPFSPMRALRRNRVIHTMGRCALIVQCTLERGGTWQGTTKNLHNNWCGVYCFQDGSRASAELEQMGAELIVQDDLQNISALINRKRSLLE